MATTTTVVKGDYGYYLDFAVTYTSGEVYDLTDQFITLKVADVSSGSNLFTSACEIVSAVGGTCRYKMTSTNAFTDTGIFKAELSITDSEDTPTLLFSVPNLSIYVVNDLPAG